MRKIGTNRTVEDIIHILENQKEELRDRFGVTRIGVFGSVARNERTGSSDIDILVDIEKSMGFFMFMQLERYLSKILGGQVDLVTRNALKPYIGKRILQEIVYV